MKNFTLSQEFTVGDIYDERAKSAVTIRSLQGEVYFYYGLVNYYQNHRRYVKSRDDNQLLGKTDPVSGDCQPFQKTSNGSLDYTPCGAIANSRFNGS